MIRLLGALFLIFLPLAPHIKAESMPNFTFKSIDGGEIELSVFKGQPILISNTASKCGFTGQYRDLQNLYDTYSADGLVVLGIPSKDFRQEYADNEKVKDFCEINFGITFPMSEVTSVIGKTAHPFYQWLSDEYNFKPRWNFNKVLIDRNGIVIASFGATVNPNSKRVKEAVLAALKK